MSSSAPIQLSSPLQRYAICALRVRLTFPMVLRAISCNILPVNLSISAAASTREELARPSGCSPHIINPEPSELNLSFRSMRCQGYRKALVSTSVGLISVVLRVCKSSIYTSFMSTLILYLTSNRKSAKDSQRLLSFF